MRIMFAAGALALVLERSLARAAGAALGDVALFI